MPAPIAAAPASRSGHARPDLALGSRRSPHLTPLRRRGLRALLRAVAPAALFLLLPLQGCSSLQPLQSRQTLHVLVVPTEQMEWMQKDLIEARQTMAPLLKAFRRLQPEVGIEVSFQNQEGLQAKLRDSSSRGLAPDLLVMRAPQAVSLLNQGLIDPLPKRDPTVRSLLRLIPERNVSRVSTDRGLAGLPWFNEFTLACYDRRRLKQPPTTLTELLTLAASGRNVGLSVDPIGLWWTAGALGAESVIAPIITGKGDAPATEQQQRARLNDWLSWLREAALQSRIEIAGGPRELTQRLESGQLAWIPCFSLTLNRLDRTMGPHLGVAPLPGGPAGPASPFSTTEIWGLGRNSSPAQRQLALQLMALSLDPLIQREMMLVTKTLLPANRFVPIPLASSGRLAALDTANRQFLQVSALFSMPFSIDQVQRVLPRIEALVLDVMVGITPPAQGVEQLLKLRSPSAATR